MKIIQALILAFVMIPTSYALNLEGINGVEILAIDGKEVNSGFFYNKQAPLTAGEHQIVVRYSKQFNNDELLQSRPTIFTLNLQHDTQISVQPQSNRKQLDKQIKAGLVWQVISHNKHYEIKNSAPLKGKGFMPYSNIEELIVTYNQQNDIVLSKGKTQKIVSVKTII